MFGWPRYVSFFNILHFFTLQRRTLFVTVEKDRFSLQSPCSSWPRIWSSKADIFCNICFRSIDNLHIFRKKKNLIKLWVIWLGQISLDFHGMTFQPTHYLQCWFACAIVPLFLWVIPLTVLTWNGANSPLPQKCTLAVYIVPWYTQYEYNSSIIRLRNAYEESVLFGLQKWMYG